MQDILSVASATTPEAIPAPAQSQSKDYNPKPEAYDAGEIAHALELQMDDGFVYELRTFPRAFVGYFADRDKALEAAKLVSGTKDVEGVYLTINPVLPELLARTGGEDIHTAKTGSATSEGDILKRGSLVVDCDPDRARGISATDAEKAFAAAKAQEVRSFLTSLGWPEPLVADSGNGTHLRYRIDLPHDKESRSLVDGVLKALSAKFTDTKTKVDTTLGNASRVCKIYGTLSAKGCNMPDRPHRLCRILEDGSRTLVTKEQLQVVAAMAPASKTASTQTPTPKSQASSVPGTYIKTVSVADGLKIKSVPQVMQGHVWTPEEVESFLEAYGWEYSERLPYEGGFKWQVTCVNNSNHQAPDTVIYLTPGESGVLTSPTYDCSHNTCRSIEPKFGWNQFVAKLRAEKPEVVFDYPQDTPVSPASVASEPKELTLAEVRRLFHTASETQNAKPITFTICGFLQEDAVTFVGGLSGHGKTLILLAMSRALLEGEPLFNHQPFQVKTPAERVVYLIPESALSPFVERMKAVGLDKWVNDTDSDKDRFWYRTLSHEYDVDLTDTRILLAVKGAHVFLDTAVRFMDGEEVADSKKFAATVFALLKAGAKSVVAAHHSAKAFDKQHYMSLENILRGSGDIGALAATCWGVCQIDEKTNQVHVENVKPRDFEPCEPFVIQGRPYINETRTFKVIRENVGRFGGRDKDAGAYTESFQPTHEMLTVLEENYEPGKRAKILACLNARHDGVTKKAMAKKFDCSDTTIKNWLDDFDARLKELEKEQEHDDD